MKAYLIYTDTVEVISKEFESEKIHITTESNKMVNIYLDSKLKFVVNPNNFIAFIYE